MTLDTRNIKDKFKGMSNEDILNNLKTQHTGLDVLMFNIDQDFNFACLVRSANNFGANVYYIGPKKWDRRGAVGTQNYTSITHLGTNVDKGIEFLDTSMYSQIVCLENNVGRSPVMLNNFKWTVNSLLIVGSEGSGIPSEILDRKDISLVEIPFFGSVRSINVASAASIAMFDYVAKTTTMESMNKFMKDC